MTPAPSGSEDIISWLQGPSMVAYTWAWTQYIWPTTVGTVRVIVNEANGETSSTTIFHSEYQNNGSMEVLTRTDTNAEGTVTMRAFGVDSRNVTLAYPTPWRDLGSVMAWSAILPTMAEDHTDTCCQTQLTTSATPILTVSQPLTTGSTDSADPSGWLYTLVGGVYGDYYEILNDTEIDAIWQSDVGISYAGCPYTTCGPYHYTTLAPAVGASTVANLLATETTTISSDDGEATDAPEPSDVEVDPVQPDPEPTTSIDEPEGTDPTPEPTEAAAEPTEADPEPTADAPEPTADAPEPTVDAPEPTVDAPEPTVDAPEPTGNAPEPTGDAPEPTEAAPEPTQGDQDPTPAVPDQEDGEDPTPDPNPAEEEPAVITVDDSPVTQQTDGNFVVGSQTLAEDNPITVGSGPEATVISVNVQATQTVVQFGQTSAVTLPAAAEQAAPEATPVITVGDEVITQQADEGFIIGSQTLVQGESITVGSGEETTVIGYNVQGEETVIQIGTAPAVTLDEGEGVLAGQTAGQDATVVVSGATFAATTDGSGAGGYIWTMLGGAPSATAGANGTAGGYTGPEQTQNSAESRQPRTALLVSSALLAGLLVAVGVL